MLIFFFNVIQARELTVVPYGEIRGPAERMSDHTSHIYKKPLYCGLIDVD